MKILIDKETVFEALEALNDLQAEDYSDFEKVTEALRQALEQSTEQSGSVEPVAWESILGAVARGWCYEENANKTMDSELAVAIAKEVQALYTQPQEAAPHDHKKQAATALKDAMNRSMSIAKSAITQPQEAAPRKPLTDEQLRVIENKINPQMRWRSSDEEGITLYPQEYFELVKAIEAAHGITGEKE